VELLIRRIRDSFGRESWHNGKAPHFPKISPSLNGIRAHVELLQPSSALSQGFNP